MDAAGAFGLYGGPVLVLDFGTATTYDLVGPEGEFMAAVTAPGIRISAKALWEDTAKLPEVEIVKPKSILAKETISSMQAYPRLRADRPDRVHREYDEEGVGLHRHEGHRDGRPGRHDQL